MKYQTKKIFIALSAAGVFFNYVDAYAGAFQLWEQDGASVGNYHAGRAVSAEDASTAYYNPAGLVRIHNQQMVFGLDPILTNFKFRGTVNLLAPSSSSPTGPQPTVAQGGGFNLAPSLNYAAPINERIVFGLSVVSPFGLETNYGKTTYAQYAATKTFLFLFDIAPSLGIKLTDHWSVGLGLDAEHARAEFDLMTALSTNVAGTRTTSENVGDSWGYGYHLGAMYQFNEDARVGLAYHSKITQHMQGSSKYFGPLANRRHVPESTHLRTHITLPATTTLSGFQKLNSTWDVMGTVIYTQWSELQNVVLQNVAGITPALAGSDSIIVVVPEHYHNSWNFSVGANYHLNEQWLFRTGIGYDQSPANDRYRNLALPDSDRIAVAFGTHYQMSEALGFDFGWTHIFAMNTRINNLHQQDGAQQTWVNGSVQSSADVFGFQVKWDIA